MKLINDTEFLKELITLIGTSEKVVEFSDITEVFSKHLRDLPANFEGQLKKYTYKDWVDGYNQCLKDCEDK